MKEKRIILIWSRKSRILTEITQKKYETLLKQNKIKEIDRTIFMPERYVNIRVYELI